MRFALLLTLLVPPAWGWGPIDFLRRQCVAVVGLFHSGAGEQRIRPERLEEDLRAIDPSVAFTTLDAEAHETRKRGAGAKVLSTNGDRAVRLPTPDGGTEVVYDISADRANDFARYLQWSKDGKCARVTRIEVGPVRPGGGPRRLLVHVEDVGAAKNQYGKLRDAAALGDPDLWNAARVLEVADKRWIRDAGMALLDEHPDPHLGNVMFRATQLTGPPPNPLRPNQRLVQSGNDTLLLEVLLVDAGQITPFVAAHRDAPLADIPPERGDILAYNREWQRRELNERLRLPEAERQAPWRERR